LEHRGIHTLRFRTFGGSTTRWAGQAAPLTRIDFTERSWVPNSGWPLSAADLREYYRRAAALLSIPVFPADEGSWPPWLLPPPELNPRLLTPFYSEFSPHPNFANTHARSLAQSRNISVVLGANVVEIVPDSRVTHVGLVRARSLSGRELEVTAHSFVVCCGGIETARLLLSSDRFAEGGIGNRYDLVGRYFQDHPGIEVGPIVSRGRALRQLMPVRRRGVKYLTKFGASEALQRSERLLNVCGEVVFEQATSIQAGKTLLRSLKHRELRTEVTQTVATIARDPLPLMRAAARHFVLRRPAVNTSGVPLLCIGSEQLPDPESRVFLTDTLDVLGMPTAALDWRLTEYDVRTLRRFAEIAAGELERLKVGTIDMRSFVLPDDPAALSGIVVDAGHHMGTTRMSAEPSTGVVDNECRVFGLANLYIGSCSVFPTSGRSNPTFTLLALSIRIADVLKKQV
jgi:choline dehydrogenase-like flavoprotein